MPRGSQLPRNDQLRACRLWQLGDREVGESVREIAPRLGVSKSTVHRWVNPVALEADRRRSRRRRDRIRRGTRR